MKCTSAKTAKMIRQFKEELNIILQKENSDKVFLEAVDENPEELRPAYDYRGTQDHISRIRKQIRMEGCIMPFIKIKVNSPISEQERELKSRMGKTVELIPGKSENLLSLY